jgi:hypothetical protein
MVESPARKTLMLLREVCWANEDQEARRTPPTSNQIRGRRRISIAFDRECTLKSFLLTPPMRNKIPGGT